MKSAKGRNKVVGTAFNSITSREEEHAACQPAHPGRRKEEKITNGVLILKRIKMLQ